MNQKDFLTNLNQKIGNISDKSILIAVSGGIDSMVLLDLMYESKLKIEVAHCNFGLRAKNSDLDEELVLNYCKKRRIPCHTRKFDTKGIAKKQHISTQMAARNLRYEWFYELLNIHKLDFLATAHHLQDNIETLLLSFTNGFGTTGLRGIPRNQNKIIRPIIDFSRDDIEHYAQINKVDWREDASNAENDYSRNKIRHQVIPVLRKINIGLEKTFERNLERLQNLSLIFDNNLDIFIKNNISTQNENILIDSKEFDKVIGLTLILEEYLKPFGFNYYQIEDIILCVKKKQIGKKIISQEFEITVERNHLGLCPKKQTAYLNESEFFNDLNQEIEIHDTKIKIEAIDKYPDIIDLKNKKFGYFDKKNIELPIEIRKWQQGDTFTPFGMNGKQKISDFLINSKISNTQKEKQLVVISNEKIIWLVGERVSDLSKIDKSTTEIIRISVD